MIQFLKGTNFPRQKSCECIKASPKKSKPAKLHFILHFSKSKMSAVNITKLSLCERSSEPGFSSEEIAFPVRKVRKSLKSEHNNGLVS